MSATVTATAPTMPGAEPAGATEAPNASGEATAVCAAEQTTARTIEVAANRRWVTLAVLCVSLLIIVIDNTIVNVTLPSLVRQLGATVSQLQWVVDAYTVVFAGLLLVAGTLGDRWGRRRSLTAGLAVFALASAAAAFAGGVGQLVTARAVMGAAAAFIMPATLSILTNTFTDARERALAIGIWSGVVGIGVVLGPLAGGFLLDHFWWGSVFVVNVPIAAGAIVAARSLVPESRDPDASRVDWIGGALSILGLVTLVTAIIEAPNGGWTATPVLGLFSLSAVTLAAFAVWESRVEHPMLDLRFFRNRRFSAASATITLMFFALFGFVFLSTQYLQFVLGYTPLAAGLRTLPFAAAMMVVAPFSAKLVERLGTKRVVVAGLVIFATGLVVASTTTVASGYMRLGVAMLLMGAGLGLASAPATDSIMGSLPRNRAGVGSAVNDTAREVGGALGVAIVGSITSSIYRSRLTGELPQTVPGPAAAAARDSLGAALQVSGHLGAAGVHVADTARMAFAQAMSRASIVSAGVAAVAAVVAWRYLPARAVTAADDATEQSSDPAPSAPWYVRACTCSYGYARTCECVSTAPEAQEGCRCASVTEAPSGLPAIDDDRVRVPVVCGAGAFAETMTCLDRRPLWRSQSAESPHTPLGAPST
jgi:EmrB/QacA subfamily drug resistance transporter